MIIRIWWTHLIAQSIWQFTIFLCTLISYKLQYGTKHRNFILNANLFMFPVLIFIQQIINNERSFDGCKYFGIIYGIRRKEAINLLQRCPLIYCTYVLFLTCNLYSIDYASDRTQTFSDLNNYIWTIPVLIFLPCDLIPYVIIAYIYMLLYWLLLINFLFTVNMIIFLQFPKYNYRCKYNYNLRFDLTRL